MTGGNHLKKEQICICMKLELIGRQVVIATIKAMTSAYIISLPQGMFKAIATAALFLVTIKKSILLSTAACFSCAYLLDSCVKRLFNFP